MSLYLSNFFLLFFLVFWHLDPIIPITFFPQLFFFKNPLHMNALSDVVIDKCVLSSLFPGLLASRMGDICHWEIRPLNSSYNLPYWFLHNKLYDRAYFPEISRCSVTTSAFLSWCSKDKIFLRSLCIESIIWLLLYGTGNLNLCEWWFYYLIFTCS